MGNYGSVSKVGQGALVVNADRQLPVMAYESSQANSDASPGSTATTVLYILQPLRETASVSDAKHEAGFYSAKNGKRAQDEANENNNTLSKLPRVTVWRKIRIEMKRPDHDPYASVLPLQK